MRHKRLGSLLGCLFLAAYAIGLQAQDAPIVADIRDGKCHMVISGQMAVYHLEVEGLQPNEPLIFDSVSVDERMVDQATASPNGTFRASMFVAVLGYAHGDCTVTIRASRCSLTATFPWSESE
jgi:hypothetical protein